MKLEIGLVLFILLAHYIADFTLQPRKIAENKSKNINALLIHILQYMFFLYLVLFIALPNNRTFLLEYVLLNGILHLITDYISSRASGYYYMKKNYHAFWCVVGLDQYVHYFFLIGLSPVLYSPYGKLIFKGITCS